MPVKVVLALVCFVLVARIAWRQEREYLARAEQELRGSPLVRELPAEYGQPAVTSAVGTRTQRRRGLKEARKAGGVAP